MLRSYLSLSGVYRDWNFSCRSWLHLVSLTLQRLVSTKRSNIFKQTDSFQLQVCLSMYDLFVEIRGQRVNILIKLFFLMYLFKKRMFSPQIISFSIFAPDQLNIPFVINLWKNCYMFFPTPDCSSGLHMAFITSPGKGIRSIFLMFVMSIHASLCDFSEKLVLVLPLILTKELMFIISYFKCSK